MFKFIHIADVHFDAPLTSKNEQLAQEMKMGQRNAFTNAINRCIAESVDALIIAGDLFDNDSVSLQTEKFLWDQFERLNKEKIKVFYAPGNHDPLITMKVNFGDNVIVFNQDEPQETVLTDSEGKHCHIRGVGHMDNNEKRNLIKKFSVKQEEDWVIGIAHAMVDSVEAGKEKGKYLPTTLDDLVKTGYDYWALGHIHQNIRFKDYPITYSGALQGLNIKMRILLLFQSIIKQQMI